MDKQWGGSSVVEKVQIQPRRPVYPTPVGLITSVDSKGRPNIIALGEVFNLSIVQPVWVGISVREATYSHGLIKEQEEFVVNLPTADLLDAVLGCGSCSGRDGIDKFQRFGLTPRPAMQVKPPLIDECPVNLECKLVGFHHVGDHDLFIGNVVTQHINKEMLDAQGDIDAGKLDTIIMMPKSFWRMDDKLGTFRI
jgi:flavin reductase (DIM6/NTAB) family NADH-FMN oxidoreductase RutF